MADYLFFFSYSHLDKSPKLEHFFTELRTAVHQKSGERGRSIDEIAFRDEENLRLGDNWSTELNVALNKSKIIVCNYSRGYFNSDYCGKEIGIFQKRISKQNEIDRKSVIIPIFWETPKICKIPEALSYLQYSQGDLCEMYKERGLHWIIKLNKESELQEFVDVLANTIVETSDSLTLPSLPDEYKLSETPSAFSVSTKKQAISITIPGGPKTAYFVFVAGKKGELESHRKNVNPYGIDGEKDWKPFNEDDEIGFIAQNIATNKRLHYNHLHINENLIDAIKEAEKKNSVVIIIVDPWSLKLNSYKTTMEQYDQISLINSGLLVSWNLSDPETANNLTDLRKTLDGAFYHCIIGNRVDFRGEITSQRDLETILGIVIEEARARLMKYAAVVFPPGLSEAKTSLPFVSGPN